MYEEEVYEAMREILPELYQRIREEINHYFYRELKINHAHYQKYVDEIIQINSNCQLQAQQEIAKLKEQVICIYQYKKEWIEHEKQYQNEIEELNRQLLLVKQTYVRTRKYSLAKEDSKALHIGLTSENQYDRYNKKWYKISQQRPAAVLQDNNHNSLSSINLTNNTLACNLNTEYYNLLQGTGYSYSLWNCKADRHHTSVLSPPKESRGRASSLLSGDTKKKLLSMIRNIK